MVKKPKTLWAAAMHFTVREGDIPKITGFPVPVENGPVATSH